MRRTRAYVGLGGNVGDARRTLEAAVAALAALPDARVTAVSDLYRTRPVGVENQPDFLNAVVALDAPTGPDAETGALALLLALKSIERAFGRRERERWGPRELDLDLLLFGRHHVRTERPTAARSGSRETSAGSLEVPHPEAQRRLFVLAPLSDLARGLVPPGWGETVESARRREAAGAGDGAVVPVGRWDRAARRWREADAAS
jgi:2-amino-4-hydroxy-6-hydroxymethyldihydropteridine diphosphokinase